MYRETTTPHTSEKLSFGARAFAFVPRLLRNVFVGYIIFVLFLVTIGVFFIDFRTSWALTPYGILFFLGAVLVGGVLCFCVSNVSERNRGHGDVNPFGAHTFAMIIVFGCALLLICQIFMIGSITIIGKEWDSPFMLNIQDTAKRTTYYSAFPNNYFLGGIFALVDAAARSANMAPQPVDCLISAVLITISVGMIAFVGRALGGRCVGFCTFMVAAVLCGISPWIWIPYSDSFGVFCPTVTLWAFVCLKRSSVKWAAIIFFSYVGYCIKPTSLAILGAIVLVCGCQWIAKRLGEGEMAKDSVINVRSLGVTVLSCALALVVALGLTVVVKDANGLELDPNKKVSTTHFLMMGMNPDEQGLFSPEDQRTTFLEKTVQDKTKKNLEVLQDRLEEMGPAGFVKLMCQKSLINYSSGDFGWSPDGLLGVRYEIKGNSQFLINFYDIDLTPTRYVDGKWQAMILEGQAARDIPCAYDIICQFLWMFVLVGIALTWFRKRPSSHEMVIAVSLLLLSAFLLFSECNPRYLFLYSPYFIALGMLGWQRAYSKTATRWQSRFACA